MFNFKELSKLMKYNYKNFLINMKPHDNKKQISDNTFYNLKSGLILLIIGYLVSLIVYALATPLVDSTSVNYFGISYASLVGNLLLVFYSLGVLAYTFKTREEEIDGKIYFGILLIALVLMLILLFRVITFIGVFSLSNLLGLLGFIAVIICFIGYGFVCVGIIDYLIILKRDYLNLTRVVKKVEIKTSTIDVDDVSMH